MYVSCSRFHPPCNSIFQSTACRFATAKTQRATRAARADLEASPQAHLEAAAAAARLRLRLRPRCQAQALNQIPATVSSTSTICMTCTHLASSTTRHLALGIIMSSAIQWSVNKEYKAHSFHHGDVLGLLHRITTLDALATRQRAQRQPRNSVSTQQPADSLAAAPRPSPTASSHCLALVLVSCVHPMPMNPFTICTIFMRPTASKQNHANPVFREDETKN